MGGLPPDFGAQEKRSFFQKALEESEDGRYKWEVVRACLKQHSISRKIHQAGTDFTAPFRPLSYWTNKGYEADRVRKCKSKQDPVLGELFQVQVETDFRRGIEESVEEQILEREQRVIRSKGKGAKKEEGTEAKEEPEWHVPDYKALARDQDKSLQGKGGAKREPAKASKDVKAMTAKQLQKLEATRSKQNRAQNALAAKAIPALQAKMATLGQCVKIAERIGAEEEQKVAIDEATRQFATWESACRDFLSAYALCPGGELKPLGFDKQTYTAALGAAACLIKSLKDRDFELKEQKRRELDAAEEKADAEKAPGEAEPKAAPKKRCVKPAAQGPETKRRRASGKQPEQKA